MKKILLANLGNRNIYYKGSEFNKLINTDEISFSSFRDFTKNLLERYNEDQQNIEPQLIPPLMKVVGNEVDKMVLFYTDSPQGERNNQDTIYEAEILQKKFASLYPDVSVELKPLKCRVIDTNELMKRYRRYLKKIATENPEHHFILCETGGTTQLKTALKIVVEYLLDQDRYEVYNISEKQTGESIVEKTESIEYRKVIDQEQIGALIRHFNYQGAFDLLDHSSGKVIKKALEISYALFTNKTNVACALASPSCSGKSFTAYPVFASVGSKNIYSIQLKSWNTTFSREVFFDLSLLLDLGHCHLQLKNYGFTVLFHHIFLERFVSEIINSQMNGLDIDNKRNWVIIREKIKNKELFPKYKSPVEDGIERTNSPSVPVKICLAESVVTEQIQPFLQTFRSSNSFLTPQELGLDYLRNKFAHEGRSISDKEIQKFLPTFAQWRTLFGLSNTTVFHSLNQELNEMLKS